MNVEDFLTDKQSEKIYYSNNQNSDEQINEQIKSFWKNCMRDAETIMRMKSFKQEC